MLFSRNPAVYLVDTLFISHPSSAHMSLFLVELLDDLSLMLLFTKESARNRVILSFAVQLVQLFVFPEVNNWFVFFLLSFLCIDWSITFSFKLSENWEISSRCVQGTPIFCQFYWFGCDLGTSLYRSSRNFLPLFVVSASSIFLFWGFLPWWAQYLSDREQGALEPPAWVQILTDNWKMTLGKLRQLTSLCLSFQSEVWEK